MQIGDFLALDYLIIGHSSLPKYICRMAGVTKRNASATSWPFIKAINRKHDNLL